MIILSIQSELFSLPHSTYQVTGGARIKIECIGIDVNIDRLNLTVNYTAQHALK
jgi:hypothetical protein